MWSYVSVALFLAVPVLLLLAWWTWVRSVRPGLPPWRNGLCLCALLLLSLNWIGAAILEVPILVNPGASRLSGLNGAMISLSHPLAMVAILLAFSLRRVPRIQAIVAGVMLLISWPLGYV